MYRLILKVFNHRGTENTEFLFTAPLAKKYKNLNSLCVLCASAVQALLLSFDIKKGPDGPFFINKIIEISFYFYQRSCWL
jgi:hypothetical protein